MSNKKFMIFLFFAIIISTFINHKVYGNSNSTISNIERLIAINHSIKKTKQSKVIADYMYKRIKTYQKYDWYERHDLLWDMHEALQNME